MLSAVAINFFTFRLILSRPKPVYDSKFGIPKNNKIDLRLIGGAALFGLGWGLSGLCPGPGAICFFTMSEGIIWVASLAVGQIAFDKTIERMEKKEALKAALSDGSTQPLLLK